MLTQAALCSIDLAISSLSYSSSPILTKAAPCSIDLVLSLLLALSMSPPSPTRLFLAVFPLLSTDSGGSDGGDVGSAVPSSCVYLLRSAICILY